MRDLVLERAARVTFERSVIGDERGKIHLAAGAARRNKLLILHREGMLVHNPAPPTARVRSMPAIPGARSTLRCADPLRTGEYGPHGRCQRKDDDDLPRASPDHLRPGLLKVAQYPT